MPEVVTDVDVEIDVEVIPDESQWPATLPEEVKAELRLRRALQLAILDLGKKMKDGEEISWEQFHSKLNQVAKEVSGIEHGIPLPSQFDIKRRLITASRLPFMHLQSRTEFEEELSHELPVRNSWRMLGDQEICVVDTEHGPIAVPRWYAGVRLRKLLDSCLLRAGMTLTAETELRAMESLKGRLNTNQWNSYVLNGVFPEYSKRSDLHYFFRKGYPTLAVSYHAYNKGKVLAALCLHPIGYYQGSHCGLMTPTDEVISHLLLMRGDEARYWKSCGQWPAADLRSGL